MERAAAGTRRRLRRSAAHLPFPRDLRAHDHESPGMQAVPDAAFHDAIQRMLAQRPRRIAPKFFYDAAGSALFDRICELPEYYPTRTELGLLRRHARDIARCVGDDADIVEFGAGSGLKARLLLEALRRPRRFIPIDISADHLHAAAARLEADYPGLAVQPLAADFTQPLALPAPLPGTRRIGFFPGSSIGNFEPGEALAFLREAAALLGGGGLLIGVDLVKDPALLHAAYNDAAGVTAAFNRNLLLRANRELGTAFEPERFAHYAFYEPRQQRIEMHLVSLGEQQVEWQGRRHAFADGESIHTEDSYKYSVDGFQVLARSAGFEPRECWCDEQRLFSLHWLVAP